MSHSHVMRKPMYFFGSIGLSLSFFASLLMVFITIRVFVMEGEWVSPLLFISIMFFLVGFQVILMGLLAEVLMKIYYQGDRVSGPFLPQKKDNELKRDVKDNEEDLESVIVE